MPIRPEHAHMYGAEWKHVIRPRILERARHRCERCRRPDREVVLVWPDGRWLSAKQAEERTRYEGDGWIAAGGGRVVTTVLTIAHLNHVAGDNRDENLSALCQRCHLCHDARQHATNAARTRDRKKAGRVAK